MRYLELIFTFLFVSSNFLPSYLNANMNDDTNDNREIMIFNFATMTNIEDWLVVNDGVMGGLSESKIFLSGSNTAIFSGNVTL
jgi:hypothetical protein